MTDTINVPRELLERVTKYCVNAPDAISARNKVRALLSAPSPAGVDGLEVYITDCATCVDVAPAKTVTDARVVLAQDAQAIIDGLRGDIAAQEETANQWRELALQFDRHRMTAMAHIRAAASGDKSAIEALGIFAALPPIPGHEITAEFEQQAQRIGELAGHLEFAVTILTVAGLAGNAQVEAMRAALSAGKEGE